MAAAMQSAASSIGSSLGLNVLPKDTTLDGEGFEPPTLWLNNPLYLHSHKVLFYITFYWGK